LMSGEDKPWRVHLLGIAANRKRLDPLLTVIWEGSPCTLVTTDAARIRAQVGQGRPITTARAVAADNLCEAFAVLLDGASPEFAAAFRAKAPHLLELLAPAVAAASIYAVEARPRPALIELQAELPLAA